MEKLNIYELVGVAVPGVVFLFGLGAMLPDDGLLRYVLLPREMGTATVHLVLAFAIGHLLQVFGQLIHRYYWLEQGGLPTDWPFTRPHGEFSADVQRMVIDTAGRQDAADLHDWRRAVAAVRTLITGDGLGRRLETFHANYGMFRSLVIAGVLLLLAAPWSQSNLWLLCPPLALGILVAVVGMHLFGVHYARELFGAVRAWRSKQRLEAPAGNQAGTGHTSASVPFSQPTAIPGDGRPRRRAG